MLSLQARIGSKYTPKNLTLLELLTKLKLPRVKIMCQIFIHNLLVKKQSFATLFIYIQFSK